MSKDYITAGVTIVLAFLFGIAMIAPQYVHGQVLRVLTVVQGGTSTSTIPNAGDVLVGLSDGTYAPRATSTLGIVGGAGGSSVSDWLQANGALTPSTTIGIRVNASSTIGDGTGAGGLTVLGNSTTTGGAYFAGNVGVGTNAPGQRLDIVSVDNSVTTGLKIQANNLTQSVALGWGGIIGTYDFDVSPGSGRILTLHSGTGNTVINPTSGNVGIGSTSPSRTLTVSGDAIMANLTATDTLTVSGLSTLTSATGTTLQGFGLYDCDSASNAVIWDVTTSKFGCQSISASGDGVSNWTFNGTSLTPTTTPVGVVLNGTSTLATSTIAMINGTHITGSTTMATTFVGTYAGANFPTGASSNTFMGYRAGTGGVVTTGAVYNIAVGTEALNRITSGSANTAMGWRSLFANTTGVQNTALGALALNANVSGSRNIGLGTYAGQYETGSDGFYVDNYDRGSSALEKTSALLYGTFNSTPASQTLNINASTTLFSLFNKGFYRDSTGSVGALGEVLQSTVTGTDWVATSTLFSSLGTVTSVDMSVPTGLSISGNPVTTSGTLALTLTSGYNIPLSASTTNWNTFYDSPSDRITAGTGIDWSGNTLNGVYTAGDGLTLTGEDFDCDTASATVLGCLTAGDWNIFNNKLASTSIDTSAELATILTDETGTAGSVVFSVAPTLTGVTTLAYASTTGISGTNLNFTNATSSTSFQTNLLGIGTDYISDITGTGIINTAGSLQASLGTSITASEMADGDHGFFTYATNVASVDAGAWTSANLASYLTDETGTGNVVFSTSPVFTGGTAFAGIKVSASSTLGLASSTALTATRGFFTDATSTTSFFSALGTFTNTIVTTLATFLNATFTGLVDIGAGVLEIPNGTAPTVDSIGELALDSTSNQLVLYGSAKKVYGDGNFYPSFTYATSTTWTGTTTIPLGTAYVAETWNGVQCFTDTGTVNVDFGDGTNWMNATTSKALNPVPTHTLSSNNTFTAGETRYARVGTPVSTPTKVSCTVSKSITSD